MALAICETCRPQQLSGWVLGFRVCWDPARLYGDGYIQRTHGTGQAKRPSAAQAEAQVQAEQQVPPEDLCTLTCAIFAEGFRLVGIPKLRHHPQIQAVCTVLQHNMPSSEVSNPEVCA